MVDRHDPEQADQELDVQCLSTPSHQVRVGESGSGTRPGREWPPFRQSKTFRAYISSTTFLLHTLKCFGVPVTRLLSVGVDGYP